MSKNTAKLRKREPKKSTAKDKMKLIIIISVAISIVSAILTLILIDSYGLTKYKNLGLVGSLLIGVIPFTIFQMKEMKRRDGIDQNLPLFLLALLSSVRTGMGIEDAIKTASERNLGALTIELKNLNANIGWGFPLIDCFKLFSQRCNTKISKRVSILIEMSIRIGGDISENLEMIQQHVSEMVELEKNRKSSLAPHMYTIYISFVVFLAIALLLTSNFVPEIEKVKLQFAQNAETNGNMNTSMFDSIKNFDPQQLKTMMFNMAVIEGVFGGLAIGKISSSSYLGGIKHIVIMVTISVVAFTLI